MRDPDDYDQGEQKSEAPIWFVLGLATVALFAALALGAQ